VQSCRMRRKTGGYLALGALFFIGALEIRASEERQGRMTIVVYDYVGINHETLLRAEGEADQIIRHAGVEVVWRNCYTAANSSGTECPNVGPSPAALRLVSHFRLVPGHFRVDTMGFSIGNMMTVSWEQAEKVARSGAGPLTRILGVTIAHEFGHLLLGNAHSVSGIMRARLGRGDWELAQKGWLVFHPSEAAALRKELRTRSETMLLASNAP
jgi:hypothetical protein